MQGYMNRPIMADAPRWFLDKEMTKKCQIPASPNVPYWVVAQREDSDVSALQGLIDIAEDEENSEIEDELDDMEDEEYDIEDLDDEDYDDDDDDEDYDDEDDDEDLDDEDYEDFIDDEYDRK